MKLPSTRPTRVPRKRKVAARVRAVDASALAAARQRRLDALENDNHAAEQEAEALAGEDAYDPGADSDDGLTVGRSKKRKKKRAPKRTRRGAAKQVHVRADGMQRWNKSLAQALEEEGGGRRPIGMVAYQDIEARPSRRPSRPFCSVCGFHAAYTCTRCLVRFCSVPCGNLHNETRCLKFTT